MEKKMIIKWGLCSIGATWILVCLTMLVMLIAICIGGNLTEISILIGWFGLVLLGIELIRKQLMNEYHVSFLKWFLLTVLPPILAFVIYICFYVLVVTNISELDLLEEMLIYIPMVVWGECVCVLTVGILLIALIRYGIHILRRKIKKM